MCSTETAALEEISGRSLDPARPARWRGRARGCRCSKGRTKYPISVGTMSAGLNDTWHIRSPLATPLPSPVYATVCWLCLASILMQFAQAPVWTSCQHCVAAVTSRSFHIPMPALWVCRLRAEIEFNVVQEIWDGDGLDLPNSNLTVRWLHSKYNCFLISVKFSLSGASGPGENQPSNSCHCENAPPFGPTELGMLSSNFLHTNCNRSTRERKIAASGTRHLIDDSPWMWENPTRGLTPSVPSRINGWHWPTVPTIAFPSCYL